MIEEQVKLEQNIRNMELWRWNRPAVEYTNIKSEPDLMDYVLTHPWSIPELHKFPYLWKCEYLVNPPYSQCGKGDLVFSNGKDLALVIELKFLSTKTGKTARNQRKYKRKKVRLQALKYAKLLKESFPSFRIFYGWITNQDLRPALKLLG